MCVATGYYCNNIYVVSRAVCIYVLVKEQIRNATMCTIGAKNEFIFYPHGVNNEKILVHYLPHFHSKIAPTLITCLCCSNWFMIHRNSTVVALHPNVRFMLHFRSGTSKTYLATNVLRNLKNVLRNFFRYTCT